SPDGRWLATGSGREFRLWEVGSWQLRHVIPKIDESGVPGVVDFSDDGRLMAVRDSMKRVKLIEAATGRELAALEPPFTSPLDELSFSPGGTLLAARTRTKVACVWDLRRLRRGLAERGLDWGLP